MASELNTAVSVSASKASLVNNESREWEGSGYDLIVGTVATFSRRSY
jgi:hypothetical protein